MSASSSSFLSKQPVFRSTIGLKESKSSPTKIILQSFLEHAHEFSPFERAKKLQEMLVSPKIKAYEWKKEQLKAEVREEFYNEEIKKVIPDIERIKRNLNRLEGQLNNINKTEQETFLKQQFEKSKELLQSLTQSLDEAALERQKAVEAKEDAHRKAESATKDVEAICNELNPLTKIPSIKDVNIRFDLGQDKYELLQTKMCAAPVEEGYVGYTIFQMPKDRDAILPWPVPFYSGIDGTLQGAFVNNLSEDNTYFMLVHNFTLREVHWTVKIAEKIRFTGVIQGPAQHYGTHMSFVTAGPHNSEIPGETGKFSFEPGTVSENKETEAAKQVGKIELIAHINKPAQLSKPTRSELSLQSARISVNFEELEKEYKPFQFTLDSLEFSTAAVTLDSLEPASYRSMTLDNLPDKSLNLGTTAKPNNNIPDKPKFNNDGAVVNLNSTGDSEANCLQPRDEPFIPSETPAIMSCIMRGFFSQSKAEIVSRVPSNPSDSENIPTVTVQWYPDVPGRV